MHVKVWIGWSLLSQCFSHQQKRYDNMYTNVERSAETLHCICTTQIVAIAKDKIHEAHEVVTVAAIGTVGCVQHSMEHVMSRVLQADNQSSQPVLERAINAAGVGLDSVLNISEALIDRVLPPTEEDKGTLNLGKLQNIMCTSISNCCILFFFTSQKTRPIQLRSLSPPH